MGIGDIPCGNPLIEMGSGKFTARSEFDLQEIIIKISKMKKSDLIKLEKKSMSYTKNTFPQLSQKILGN